MQNYANLTRTRRFTRHFTRPLNNAINEFQMTFIGFQYTIELSEDKISPTCSIILKVYITRTAICLVVSFTCLFICLIKLVLELT